MPIDRIRYASVFVPGSTDQRLTCDIVNVDLWIAVVIVK